MKKSDTRELIIIRRGYRKTITGDKFSLYISNYPVVARYLKRRIGDKKKVLAELCCGVGVTLEYIGDSFKHIIGVDINRKILSHCKSNLNAIGLLPKSTLILGDINRDEVLGKIKADVVIYDVPFWSSHEYENRGDLTNKNPQLKNTVQRIRKFIASDIIIFCSSYLSYELVKREVGSCEFQKVFVNGKHDRNHVYLGALKQKNGITEINLST